MQGLDFSAIAPELILLGLATVLLLLELVIKQKEYIAVLTLFGVLAAFFSLSTRGGSFADVFELDAYSYVFKVIFLVNLTLTILLSIRYMKIKNSSFGEYYSLLVFSTVGMMLMVSATNLMLIYLGLELMALSTYILAGFIRHDKHSTEAALKYFLMGAFSTAIILYGMSLLYGTTGTMDIARIGAYIHYRGLMGNPLLLISMVLFIVSFGFKIAAVPFHMWAPDVYEGAPTSVTAFMSVGPKAAGFAVLAKVLLTVFPSMIDNWSVIVTALAILTMLVGNLIALAQSNLKRMLAYSSIAHAGYMLLGLVPGSAEGVLGIMTYLFIYMFMNVGAFSILILLTTQDCKCETLNDLEGLAKTHPFVAAIMLVFMFSLAGIPPTGGFIGKFSIFLSLLHAQHRWLAIAAVLFSAISAFYYLRVVMYMYMRQPEVARPDTGIADSFALRLALSVSLVMTLMLGIMPQQLIDSMRHMFRFI
ncbi:MAG: NADH-quinone oxidoreductase subunit N [Nitrospirae bacterium]|uniref:NADH-quinone oxidoreductase subunit N n=1 Tax=Candidatus Magnetobacterium casense TaxID=1455061 RepID=UPI00058BF903|nr:NADH-quinone oxidoreductase subunit N [Candidatus Magnetobacterium casensis]MBF0338945.1 NADH-quinone oxidoreductase subunit N [Nitrospirota bacterium]